MGTRRRLRSLVTVRRSLVLLPVAALLAFFAWGLSSAVGSSPDDDFHLSSIWCGLGDREGLCEDTGDPGEREVPRDLVIDAVCFAFVPEASAECQGDDFGTRPDDTVATPRGNFTGLYPPVYYAVTGLAAGPDVAVSVVVIRFLNAALYLGLVSAAFLLLPGRLRPALIAGVILPLVPLGMFIVPSTNPSGWAILSAAVLWVSMLGYFESSGRRKAGLAVIATVATLMGAGARADAAIYAIIGLAGAVFLAARRDGRFLRDAILPLALAVLSGALYLTAAQSSAAMGGLGEAPPEGLSAWIGLFAFNLINVPSLWAGVLGMWNLGWLDTPLPSAVWLGVLVVVVAAVAHALMAGDVRKRVAVAGLLGLLFLVPAYILTQSNAVVGAQVQPRYIMPLLVMLCGVAALELGPARTSWRAPLVIGATVLALANSLALFIDLRRYVTGLDTRSFDLDAGAEWWWPGSPLSPMAVWILGSLAFAAALALLVRVAWPPGSAGLQEVAQDVGVAPAREPAVVAAPEPLDHRGDAG